MIWAGFLRDRTLGSRVEEGSAVHQEEVQTTVVVIVEEGSPRAHGLRQVVFGGVGRDVIEANAECGSDIGELAGGWLLRIDGMRGLRGKYSPDNYRKEGKAQESAHA